MSTPTETSNHSSDDFVENGTMPFKAHSEDALEEPTGIAHDTFNAGVKEARPTFKKLKSIERHRREILLRVSYSYIGFAHEPII